jgi:LmbE family N-acetylglucosaminyl deacetylase
MLDFPNLLNGARVLVIAPHADDETQGAGGTIAKAIDAGANVAVMVVSAAGIAQYRPTPGVVPLSTRLDELQRAMSILGVGQYEVLYIQEELHCGLDAIPRRDLVAKIERDGTFALDKFQPDIVLCPASSYHQDHQAVHDAVVAACRPHHRDVKPFVDWFLVYDQPQVHWVGGKQDFHPTLFVDISRYEGRKLRALEAYKSQNQPFPHNASIPNIAAWTRCRGGQVSVAAAEAFQVYRMVM